VEIGRAQIVIVMCLATMVVAVLDIMLVRVHMAVMIVTVAMPFTGMEYPCAHQTEGKADHGHDNRLVETDRNRPAIRITASTSIIRAMIARITAFE